MKTRAFLIFCAVGLVPIALGYGAKPVASLNALFGITVDTTNLTHIMRAVMGLYFGMVVIWLWGAFSRLMAGPALVTCAVFMLGLAAGRLLSFVLDGMPHWLLMVYAILEIVLGVTAVLLYKSQPTPKKYPLRKSETLQRHLISMKKILKLALLVLLVAGVLAIVFFLRKEHPVAERRFVEPDKLFQILQANVRDHAEFEVIVDIDHARLGAKAGSPMPPSHVLIWSDAALEAAILKHNPVAAVDLPLRVLAYENQQTGKAALIYNTYDFVAQRHSLPEDAALRDGYESAVAKAVKGVPESTISKFPSDAMPAAGLVTLTSPYDFQPTEKRVRDAIAANPDTVPFGEVDFTARSKAHGVELRPLKLILFGGPGPGGRAMASAPTLGLDAFCQKLLIWQDEKGTVYVTFNDLLALAERQGSGGLPLRVINRRMKKTFSEALAQ